MKANELRIGNYILLQGVTKPTQVWIIDTTEQSTRTKASPIQLTEEWLLKFGFGWKNFAFRNGTFTVRFQKEFYVYLSIEGVRPIQIKLDYVHQLQNLYFALTGEELTYGGGEQ
jgi:hypothetical protein